MIFVAADHYGIEAKQVVTDWLKSHGIAFTEFGSRAIDEECSIADFIPKLTSHVLQSSENRGIMICGTGIGVAIGANRFKGIRAILASNPNLAEWSRAYDNANVLCLSGWNADAKNIREILNIWFSTEFSDPNGIKNEFLSAMDRWT